LDIHGTGFTSARWLTPNFVKQPVSSEQIQNCSLGGWQRKGCHYSDLVPAVSSALVDIQFVMVSVTLGKVCCNTKTVPATKNGRVGMEVQSSYSGFMACNAAMSTEMPGPIDDVM
jgi:hypothetical protein